MGYRVRVRVRVRGRGRGRGRRVQQLAKARRVVVAPRRYELRQKVRLARRECGSRGCARRGFTPLGTAP